MSSPYSQRVATGILVVFIISKTFCYVGLRFLYPFAQFLARDWSVSTEEMGLILSMTEFAAIPAGFLGFVGDRVGADKLTAVSYFGICVCSAMMLLPPVFGALLVIRFFFGFFRDLSMVAIQDYCCQFFPKHRQDMITGALELSYSLSALAGVPLLGLAYDAWGWTAPFLIIAVCMFAFLPPILYILYKYQAPGSGGEEEEGATPAAAPAGVVVGGRGEGAAAVATAVATASAAAAAHSAGNEPISSRIQDDDNDQPPSPSRSPSAPPGNNNASRPTLGYLSGLQYRNGALAFNLSGLFFNLGANLLATEFSILLADVYRLNEAESGTASLAMSVGELVGGLLTMLPWIDPTSFRTMRFYTLAAFVCSIPYIFWGASSLDATLAMLFFIFIAVEFGCVQRFSRAPQFAAPGDAIAMLGVNVQFQYAGRTIGAALAGVIFVNSSHAVVCVVATVSFLLSVGTLELAVRQYKRFHELHHRHDDGDDEDAAAAAQPQHEMVAVV